MMGEDTTYNGWTNKPTWMIGMYIDGNYSGEGTCRFYEDMIADSFKNATPETPGELPIRDLAETLKRSVEDDIDAEAHEANRSGIVGDLLGWSLAVVNWEEIAESRLSDKASEAAS